MGEIIKVGMADWKVCNAPDGLTTLGLGSCVGVVLFDTVSKLSGMAHVMLPDSTLIKNNSNRAKFADTCIEDCFQELIKMGANKRTMVSKIAGGAQMFSFAGKADDLCRVGDRNTEAVKKKLGELNIRIIAEDTGGCCGRTIIFMPDTGELTIKAVGKESRII